MTENVWIKSSWENGLKEDKVVRERGNSFVDINNSWQIPGMIIFKNRIICIGLLESPEVRTLDLPVVNCVNSVLNECIPTFNVFFMLITIFLSMEKSSSISKQVGRMFFEKFWTLTCAVLLDFYKCMEFCCYSCALWIIKLSLILLVKLLSILIFLHCYFEEYHIKIPNP